MKRVLDHKIYVIMVILFLSSLLLFFDIPTVDDVPYHSVIREDCVTIDDFADADADDGRLRFVGETRASAQVSLTEGKTFLVRFTAKNNSKKTIKVHVNLYGGDDYDWKTLERICQVKPGEGTYEAELSFFREKHPEKAELRFYTNNKKKEIELTDVSVDLADEVTNGNRAVTVCWGLAIAVLVLSLAYVVFYLCGLLRGGERIPIEKKKFSAELLFYGSVAAGAVALLFLLYRRANLAYPLAFNIGDDPGVYYMIKTIKEYGVTLVNPRTGGATGADMFDYITADKLSFLWVKLISLFVDNVYMIANLTYFLFYILNALAAAAVCRRLRLGRAASYIAAMLFAFSPYIQHRYMHLWLTPYYMLPFAVLIAINVIEGDIEPKSRRYWNYAIVAFACGFTGMYYAWFACALFAVAIVVRMACARKKERLANLKYGLYIAACSFGVLVNLIPSMIYWVINGFSTSSEIAFRTGAETEIYGLKLVQMVLPRLGHRIGFLADITQKYTNSYPLVNENYMASLGIISVLALIAVVLNLLGKEKVWTESKLILSMFLIGTIGGIGTLISVFIKLPMRCYNRVSLVVMFLCLLVTARFIDRLRGRIPPWMFAIVLPLILALGIYDQTVTYAQPDYTEFEASRKFIGEIEETLDAGDMVYVLPALNWPSEAGYKNHIGYIESKDLRWSYGAAQGREETRWQRKVAKMEADQMIQILREAGYDGIYFDSALYGQHYGEDDMKECSDHITEELGQEPLISEDGILYFWDIREQRKK